MNIITKTKAFQNIILWFSLSKKEQKAFLWILTISLLCLWSLFQANSLYMDDLFRTNLGVTNWEHVGRPMSSWLSLILQWGKPLTDISPLPQIICLVLYCLSFVLVAKFYTIKSVSLLILSGVIFVINPYNLAIYSFVYDSFPMSCGVLCAVTGFIFITIAIEYNQYLWNKILLFILAIVSLVFSLSLYQPTTAYYLIAFLFYLLTGLLGKVCLRKSLLYLLIYCFTVICSFVAYLPIKNFYIQNPDSYGAKHSQIPSLELFIPTIIENFKQSWITIHLQLGNTPINFLLRFIGILMTITIIYMLIRKVYYLFILQKTTNQNNLLITTKICVYIIITLLYLFFILNATMFPSMILSNPTWSVRTFMGFSGIVGFSSLFLSQYWSSSKLFYLKDLLIFILSLLLLSFANVTLSYGNVIFQQNIYEQRVGSSIVDDIENNMKKLNLSLETLPKISFVFSENSYQLKRASLNLKAFEKHPILSHIAYSNYSGSSFGITKFTTMGFAFERISPLTLYENDNNYYTPKTSPIVNRQLYRIYWENDIFIVIFNN